MGRISLGFYIEKILIFIPMSISCILLFGDDIVNPLIMVPNGSEEHCRELSLSNK